MSDIYPKIPKGKVLPQTKESPSFKKKTMMMLQKLACWKQKQGFALMLKPCGSPAFLLR